TTMRRPNPDQGPLGERALVFADALYNLARYLTGDPSEAADLVQETYARALAAAVHFLPGSNLKAWLFRILRNCFIDGYRRRRRAPLLADAEIADAAVDAEAEASGEWLRDDHEL